MTTLKRKLIIRGLQQLGAGEREINIGRCTRYQDLQYCQNHHHHRYHHHHNHNHMYCKKHVNIAVWRSCYIWLDSPDPTYANLALALILPWLICRFFCCNRKCPGIEFVRSWFQLQSWNLTTQEYISYMKEYISSLYCFSVHTDQHDLDTRYQMV